MLIFVFPFFAFFLFPVSFSGFRCIPGWTFPFGCRYDARGALHDLAPYEPPPGGYQNRLEGLTAAEQKAEQLCEEERYYSLYNNEVEEEMYQGRR